jgi:hypothetical protein
MISGIESMDSTGCSFAPLSTIQGFDPKCFLQLEFHLITDEVEQCYVTGLTSAIARGWCTAGHNGFTWIGLPPFGPVPTQVAEQEIVRINIHGLPWGVEIRTDADGHPYRMASPKRTLLVICANVEEASEFFLDELWRGAISEAKAHGRTLDINWILEQAFLHDTKRGQMLKHTFNLACAKAKKFAGNLTSV